MAIEENAIQQLIRTKLNTALVEEKKRVAASLFEVIITQPDKKIAAPSNGAQKQHSREAKQQQIQALKIKISQLSSTASQSKDPDKMRAQLDIQKAKLDVAQKELAAIE